MINAFSGEIKLKRALWRFSKSAFSCARGAKLIANALSDP